MNPLIKKFFGFSIGPVIGAFISFITVPITTYFVLPQEYGKASMFTVIQGLIVTILYLGIDQAYTREYHESKDKKHLLLNSMLVPILLSLLIFIIISLNLEKFSSLLFGSSEYLLATFLFGVTIIFLVFERFIMLSIRMEEKAIEYSIVSIILRLNVLIFTLLFVFFIRRDFLAVVYSTAFGQIIVDFYLIIRYRKSLNLKGFSFDNLLFKKSLKFGMPLILSAALNNLLHSIDRISLRAWSNFYEIGIFTAALKITAPLTIIQTSFTSFWTPTAYRWNSQKKEAKYYDLVSKVVLLVLSIIFCMILIFKDLAVLLLGKEYADARYLIGLLCLYPIMYTLSETTSLGIAFSRKSYLNMWVSLISIVPNIILNYLLIPEFGAVGAAIATGVSFVVFFLGRSYFSMRNWRGFPLKQEITVSFILLFAALINTFDCSYITVINIIFLLLILLLQVPTIKKLITVRKKDKEWDFS